MTKRIEQSPRQGPMDPRWIDRQHTEAKPVVAVVPRLRLVGGTDFRPEPIASRDAERA